LLAKADQQKVLLGIKEAVSEEKIWAALGDRWGPAIAAFDLVVPVHSVQGTQPSFC